ncbi:hypothetical protein M422DRAFT_261620 [Sphaerobolus stellatus SS14]|uniref:Uncharacterized protein n=1 Tax=Sphaerobolus stellatus (strain SS14) TaxID=990650 RepID=A0A0C9U048_SPHS4|nr:hypothetical protein M422DRAFT_261620 [Sphaerobolus stellatus SS14]
MDIRAIKLTNKDKDHLGNDPFEVLPDVIPVLDFDYMSNPENGECVIDRGISASPEPDQPMIGLWNLTKVDASFAQAGTNTPRLFNVGTLADYGAVFAEYPIDRASVIQMRYCMAYNLIFAIVRGNIQFPENSDAYAANGTFHAHINQIINLYTDAKQSSYGVRDELPASIQTVKSLLPVAKQKVAAYVNAKTVIWIPSRIYFDFWIRHIQELKFLQTRVAKQRPSNACNLTLLNMYLIKSIVTNPHEDSFTRFVLQDLNFQPSSQHFAFLPHKSHWKGLPDGPKQLSFGERFKSFFPPLEADFLTSSVWHILKGIGYLKDYHTFLSTKSEHDILCLQDGLKAAFDLLECLPDKKTDSWCWPPKKNTNIPRPRAIATHTRIEALLLADNLNISFNNAAKHIKGNHCQAQKQDRCSAKHKNKRKLPQKIQRSQGSSANENQEIQQEHLEEDSEEVNGDPIQDQDQDYGEEESDYFNIESEDSEDVYNNDVNILDSQLANIPFQDLQAGIASEDKNSLGQIIHFALADGSFEEPLPFAHDHPTFCLDPFLVCTPLRRLILQQTETLCRIVLGTLTHIEVPQSPSEVYLQAELDWRNPFRRG